MQPTKGWNEVVWRPVPVYTAVKSTSRPVVTPGETGAPFSPRKLTSIERRVARKRLVSGSTTRVVQSCPAGTRLLGAQHAYAFRVGAQPGTSLLDAVNVRQTVAGRSVVARASVDASVPRRLQVELQVHALCTKVTR